MSKRIHIDLVKVGERLLVEDNLMEFDQFIRKHFMTMNHDLVMAEMERLTEASQLEKAVKLWHKIVSQHSDADVIGSVLLRGVWKICWWSFVIGGSIGGWIVLIRMLVK